MGVLEKAMSGMAMQFERSGDGYLYRANGKGPPIAVSAAERDRYVNGFGLVFAAHVGGLMVAVIAAAMVTAQFFPDGNEPGGFLLMGSLLAGTAFLLFRSVRWWLLAPARAFAERSSSSLR